MAPKATDSCNMGPAFGIYRKIILRSLMNPRAMRTQKNEVTGMKTSNTSAQNIL
jgi:hypothetical protein